MSASKSTPGILRRPSLPPNSIQQQFSPSVSSRPLHGANLGSPMQTRAVHFEPPSNLRDLLIRASNEKTYNPKLLEELEGHLTHLKNQRGQALVSWLQLLQENISTLKPKMENFVIALLKIAWANQEPNVVAAYRNFLTNLVSAQGYYVKPVVRMLISNFIGFTDRHAIMNEQSCGGQVSSDIDQMESLVFDNTHLALEAILEVTPLASRHAVLQYAKECLPYAMTTDTRAHTKYIENLMRLVGYMKSDRRSLLRIVISRLVELDAHLPQQDDDEDDLFSMETAGYHRSAAEVARDSLDSGLVILFTYIKELAALSLDQKDEKDPLKDFYFDFLSVFESVLLPVYATGHVQFLMFYLLSFRPAFVGHFLDHFWKLFISVNTPNILRQSAIAYIASLIARARYVRLHVLMACLEKVVTWVHSYIGNREPSMSNDFMFVDIKSHGAFYAACQASLYIFAFRHEEMVSSRKHLSFLRSLQLNTIVTCQLNPLRVCLPPVVKNFAAIARNYQLAYCDTIIQRNSRISLPVIGNLSSSGAPLSSETAKPLLLDSFFPFDPYRLTKSKIFIQDLYREYQGALDAEDEDEESSEDEEDEEEDMDAEETEDVRKKSKLDQKDQLMELEKIMMDVSGKSYPGNSSVPDFLYGTSPGFLS